MVWIAQRLVECKRNEARVCLPCFAGMLLNCKLDKGSEKWSNAVIFYVIGMKPTAAVYRFIASQWNNVALPVVYMHEDGYFIIRIASKDDMHSILYSGPHMFFGKPI